MRENQVNKSGRIGAEDWVLFNDESLAFIDVEKICENFEKDSRRYKRYMGNDSKAVFV